MKNLFNVLLLLISLASDALATEQTIKLETGDIKKIQLPESSQIFVSRRGVITLNHDHGHYWNISAKRAGNVKISVKNKAGEELIFLVQVHPRKPKAHLSRINLHSRELKTTSDCQPPEDDQVFVLKILVEMMDHSNKAVFGFEPNTQIQISKENLGLSVGLNSEPYKNAHQRQIIANPVVVSQACNDITLRTGGEDEISSLNDDGRAVTAWKAHGLDMKLKIIPSKFGLLEIPFFVGLRTPSKGQGTYGVTDVQSTIKTIADKETLAAVINLSSTLSFERSQFWISDVPIVGPWFRRRDNTRANSTLLVWLKIIQRSVRTENP